MSQRRQSELLSVSRSVVNYQKKAPYPKEGKLMRYLDELYMKDPCLGSRRLVPLLAREHEERVNRKKIQRVRRKMGIETIWCRPRRTSIPEATHRKYPYLLRNRAVENADEVWCSDITYIPMPHGHAYLCAVMDWHSRKVLGWAISNTMDATLTGAALSAALVAGQSTPLIFNTDQGSQFTSKEWTGRLEAHGIEVSMDGKGRWMDNVFIERLWRSVKYEEIYLKEYASVDTLERGLVEWFERYNSWRPHQALGNRTPSQSYVEDRKGKSLPVPQEKIAA
jgi:putative transposase